MARKKTAPPSDAPPPRPKARGTMPTQIRLTPDDVARIALIGETYAQATTAGAIRMALLLVASAIDAGHVPQVHGPARKSGKKSGQPP